MTNTANSVDVYRNLHRKCYSVRSRYRLDYGRVIGHQDKVVILNASMIVGEKGRQRVIREGRKNVHAFVRGDMAEVQQGWDTTGMQRMSYNPFKAGHFVDSEGQPVYTASVVILDEKGAWFK